jgi:60 kDa SS-A/Ro ribonucleoprotein
MQLFSKLFHGRTNGTSQLAAQPDRDQVRNSAGGFVYALDAWARLDRFLILGTEGGTFYAGERELTKENAQHLTSLVRENGMRVVERIVEISKAGRAPKVSPALFALAMCAGFGDEATRRLALGPALGAVCRTGSHLLEFAAYVEQFRGWGRGLRTGVGNWYLEKAVGVLAYQVLKYQNRHGFTHRDLLRLAHPSTEDAARRALFAWVVDGTAPADPVGDAMGAAGDAADAAGNGLALIAAYERAKCLAPANAAECAALVRETRLPREALPTDWLREPAVWEALLEDMPMTAMLRNLASMTRVGLLTPLAEATQTVVARLRDNARLRKARVHPVAVLGALATYRSGRSARGSGTWTPLPVVTDALEDAFYASFEHVEPTGARTLVGLDVSGSMSCGAVSGMPGLTPRAAASAMAMTHVRTEANAQVCAFTDRFVDLNVKATERLGSLMHRTEGLPFDRTDCALPMLFALERRLEVDTFVVYTDNETWAGTIHPDEALRTYRERTGIPAKLAVVGMSATGFTIADPNDAGMLDVVGFDSAAPAVIADFARTAR